MRTYAYDSCGEGRLSIHSRPLVWAAIAFAVGVGLCGTIWGAIAATSVAVLLAAGATLTRRGLWKSAAMLMLFAAAGAWRQQIAAVPAPNDVSGFIGSGYVTLCGKVASDVERRMEEFTCQIAALSCATYDGRAVPCTGRIVARLRTAPDARPPDYGNTLEVRGRIEPPAEARNPGEFDYAAYLAHRGIYARIVARRSGDWRVLPVKLSLADGLPWVAARARASMQSTFYALLPPTEATLLTGIVLGCRADIPIRLQDDFVITGTAHILSTSGLNVGLIAVLAAGVCGLMRLGRRATAAIILGALAFYTLMAGARPPILRADVMATVYLLGRLLHRESDALNALASAALLILAFEPGYLFDVGFQLSFAIVTALAVMLPIGEALWRDRLSDLGPGRHWLEISLATFLGALAVTAVAQIAAAPLIAQHFNMVSLVAFPANALIVPVVGLLLGGGFATWLCAFVWPFGAKALALGLSQLLAYLIGVTSGFAELPYAAVSVQSPGWWLVALYYSALGFATYWMHSYIRRDARQYVKSTHIP
ncbi:MAG TPA: ComEC/Rec2 family competence protein [Chthonomonadales bacterium]|nr:ComEC/Rec2 family competence protein [Chthonomonadales bacterium]